MRTMVAQSLALRHPKDSLGQFVESGSVPVAPTTIPCFASIADCRAELLDLSAVLEPARPRRKVRGSPVLSGLFGSLTTAIVVTTESAIFRQGSAKPTDIAAEFRWRPFCHGLFVTAAALLSISPSTRPQMGPSSGLARRGTRESVYESSRYESSRELVFRDQRLTPSAASVEPSSVPLCANPFSPWKRRTALEVFGPIWPSTAPTL